MNRLRRALLFVPGDSHRKIEKSVTLKADGIILELEDGVAYNQKVAARHTVLAALQKLNFGHSERLVRINALDTGLAEADLEITLPGQPDAYILPKVEQAETVHWVSQQIAEWEEIHQISIGTIRLLVIIESALGVMNLKEIATADPRLDCLIFGAEDLASSMGAVRTKDGWEGFYARSAIVTAAAAYGLEAIDTPHVGIHDEAGLKTQTQQALELGYSGKLAIHPNQLATIQQIFTPSSQAVAKAQQLLEAYETHLAAGSGAFTLEGKMVDKPMVRSAEKILVRASQIEAYNA